MNYMTKSIQSTVYPENPLSEEDWRYYLKIRNVEKIKLVKHLTIKVNQILNQKLK